MKKCPYCAEVIQDEAIKCRYCKSDLNEVAIKDKDVDLDKYRLKPLEEISSNKRKEKANRYKGTNFAKCHIPNLKGHYYDIFYRFYQEYCGFNTPDEFFTGGNNNEANFAIFYDDDGFEKKIEYLNTGYYDQIKRSKNDWLYFDRFNKNNERIYHQNLKFNDVPIVITERNTNTIKYGIERNISHIIEVYEDSLGRKNPKLKNNPCWYNVYDVMGNIIETWGMENSSETNIKEPIMYKNNKSMRYKYHEDGRVDKMEDQDAVHFPLTMGIKGKIYYMEYVKEGNRIIQEYKSAYNHRKIFDGNLLIEQKAFGFTEEGWLGKQVERPVNMQTLTYDSRGRVESITTNYYSYETQWFGKDKIKMETAQFSFKYEDY